MCKQLHDRFSILRLWQPSKHIAYDNLESFSCVIYLYMRDHVPTGFLGTLLSNSIICLVHIIGRVCSVTLPPHGDIHICILGRAGQPRVGVVEMDAYL